MNIKQYDNISEFYNHTEEFLLSHEAENNLILGILSRLKLDPNHYGKFPMLLEVEQDGQIILVSIRTPPHNQILSYTHDLNAIEILIEYLAEHKVHFPGVLGFKEGAARFVKLWETQSGQTGTIAMNDRIYQLDTVDQQYVKNANFKYAREEDQELILKWAEAFNREAFHDINEENLMASLNRLKNAISQGNILILYNHENVPVTMAQKASKTPNGRCVNLVYTPPEQRQNGYATACVARLSQDILDSGKKFCFLFTDLSNPTSNSIYQKIGYHPIIDMDEYNFS